MNGPVTYSLPIPRLIFTNIPQIEWWVLAGVFAIGVLIGFLLYAIILGKNLKKRRLKVQETLAQIRLVPKYPQIQKNLNKSSLNSS